MRPKPFMKLLTSSDSSLQINYVKGLKYTSQNPIHN